MFLKTVPPVVAVHSEWRSSKNFSLPLFFNDSASDSDLVSASGTPIPQKIQMIIESLHTTQSSDMSDNGQTEKAAHSSHELPRQAGCKGQTRLADAARSRRAGTETKMQAAGSDSGEDSDSDDSVDRGIEEAIQEYLKEKVDHKRKGDPVSSSPSAPKVQRREPNIPESAKHQTHSSGGKVLTASNHIQRGSTGAQPLKKKVKKKKLSKENPFKKGDTHKLLPVKSPPLSRSKKGSSSSSEMDKSPPRLVIKEEEDWPDSSSDDGIEEEIQRFQQEKKEKQEGEKDTARPSRQREDSDSSSDEGIEEAIRRFQEEKHKQKKKKSLLKPTQLVSGQRSKPTVVSPERTNALPFKMLSKKNIKKKMASKKSDAPTPLAVSHFLNKCASQSSKTKEFTASPTNQKQTHTEHQIHSSLKVNSTAELMCAEAILDISKTVMPEVFDSNLGIANRNLLQTPPLPAVPPSDDKSDDSSVDSEEGIEQEIRKFLELKAKMNKEQPAMAGAPSPASGETTPVKDPKRKTKEVLQSKAVRLSLSRKRKFKEEQTSPSRGEDTVCNINEETPQKPTVHGDDTRSQISPSELCVTPTSTHSNSITAIKNVKSKRNSPPHKDPESSINKDRVSSSTVSSPSNTPRTVIGQDRNDSSDKSSSLDSDEDLDAAIKDLLKTKKKVKKKVRDIKARKSIRPAEASSGDVLKKQKPTEQKSPLPAKAIKPSALKSGKETLNVQAKNDKSLKSKVIKCRSEAQISKQSKSPAPTDRIKGNGGVPKDGDAPSSIPRADEDSSSVDSDDSIEQEIRRFLAERAKVAAPTAANVKQEEGDAGDQNTESVTSSAECDVKSEHQKIPTELPAATSASGTLWSSETQTEKECKMESLGALSVIQRQTDTPVETNKGPVLTPGSSCIMSFRRTENQNQTFENSNTRDPQNSSSQKGRDSLSNKGTPEKSPIIKPVSLATPSVSPGPPQSSSHQNLFLMRPGTGSMTGVKEQPSVDRNDLPISHQSRSTNRIPLKDVISAVCPSPLPKTKPPISCPAENPTGDLSTSATPGSRTEGLYLHNHTRKDRRDRSAQYQPSPVLQPRPGSSVIQVQGGQTAFTAQKTNNLQVRESLGERQREGTSDSKEESEREGVKEEEKCVDETDVESDEDRKDEKMKDRRQKLPSHSLSTSIDPGVLLSPYIALDSQERSQKFKSRRLLVQQQLKGSRVVKRRLQFVVSVPR